MESSEWDFAPYNIGLGRFSCLLCQVRTQECVIHEPGHRFFQNTQSSSALIVDFYNYEQ